MNARMMVMAVLAGAGAAQAQYVYAVSPNSRATSEGNDSNYFPFSYPSLTRYQQVFGAGSLSSLVGKRIMAVAFRLDGSAAAEYAGGFHYNLITIKFSITPQAVGSLSTNMDSNVGPNQIGRAHV